MFYLLEDDPDDLLEKMLGEKNIKQLMLTLKKQWFEGAPDLSDKGRITWSFFLILAR